MADTYTIDVFLNLPDPQPDDIFTRPDYYVGRSTRLGMGVADDKGRCVKTGVTRVLDATPNARALQLTNRSSITVTAIVTDVTRDKRLTPEEYRRLPGFEPLLAWSKPVASVPQTASSSGASVNCCHQGSHPS